MMIRIVLFSTLVILAFGATAQSNYRQKKSRKDYFRSGNSSRDYSDLRNFGLQISAGPNYTFTRLNNPVQESDPNLAQRYDYSFDPAGRLGGFLEVGMVHYRMKKPAFLKKSIIHYLDWGVGFDYIGGKQATTVNNLDALGNTVSTEEGMATFYNGYLYGRLTVHRLLKMTERTHLDYGLGFNLNYQLVSNSDYEQPYLAETERYQKEFLAQIHAQLGINIRLSRGSYLVPGIWAPVLGAHEWNSGKPTIQWFSSNYWPVHLQIKWLYNFTKRGGNGCNTGSPEDRKRNDEYMQNR